MEVASKQNASNALIAVTSWRPTPIAWRTIFACVELIAMYVRCSPFVAVRPFFNNRLLERDRQDKWTWQPPDMRRGSLPRSKPNSLYLQLYVQRENSLDLETSSSVALATSSAWESSEEGPGPSSVLFTSLQVRFRPPFRVISDNGQKSSTCLWMLLEWSNQVPPGRPRL